MKIDMMLNAAPYLIEESVDAAVKGGFDGGWVIETKHDPFLLLGSAASQQTGLQLGTAVAVAFARTPMLLAQTANDLQLTTEGRFVLGLGTQVRPHVERRFSMPWGKPVGRMREMIQAIHAIWDAWETGQPLDHRGEYYQHTLMTPAFSPGPNPHGRPPIYLGALGPAMTELAGSHADGLIVHRFVTDTYLREVTIPRLRSGLANRERPLDRPFQVVYPPFVATGADETGLTTGIAETRSQIAFYASTPAYRPSLDLHGWGALGERLGGLARAGEWAAMGPLVPDEVLDAFAVVCHADEVRDRVAERFDGLVDRAVLYPANAPKQH